MQDALKKNKKTTYFKLTLPNTGNELKVAVWASRTPEKFLLHVFSVIHACKQMGLDMSFTKSEGTVETAKIEARITKGSTCNCTTLRGEKSNKGEVPGTTPEAVTPALADMKATHKKAVKALEVAKLAVTTAGAKPFKLYGNLISDKA